MVYTYYLFWFCILFALYKKFYDYALSFFVLFLTSYLIHTRPYDTRLYYIDCVSIWLVVFVGFVYYSRYFFQIRGQERIGLHKLYTYIPIICVVLIMVVYYTNLFVYTNLAVYMYKPYPELKYEIVHVLTVIGHLCVMYLS
jgi:hypothetical protein